MFANRIVSVLMLLLLTAGFGLAYKGYDVTWSDEGVLVLTFQLGDFQIEPVVADGRVYSQLAFAGNVWTRRAGYAELPVLSASVQLPAYGDYTLEVLDADEEYVPLSHPMLPSRGVIYRNQDPDLVPYWIDPQSLALKIYPEQPARIGDPFIYRDVRGVTVFASPFQYMAREGLLKVSHTLRVALMPKAAQISTNPIAYPHQGLTSEMNGAYSSLFINYNPQAEYLNFTNELADLGEMLVIYTSRDATAIQPYVTWKREKGFKVTTQQVATGTNVKSTIQTAYNANPNLLYVQLVGDWADIKSDLGTSSSAPTDPMLGCVSGSDNFPDLIIGRFPAASATEVTTMINKAITYEKATSGTWYSKGLGIGSSEGSGIGDDGEIDYAHIDVIKENKLLPYTYTSVTEAYGSPTASAVASAINAGLSVINYCGHGADTYWVTSGFSTTNIDALTNGAMLPVIYSVACVNGTFHKTTECFAERWLRKSGGGAVATLMATINLPWTPPMRGQDYMNDLLTGGYDYAAGPGEGTSTTYGKTTFGSTVFNGSVLMYAESAASDDLDTLKTWTIFGDASLQVRTATPATLSLSNTAVQSGVAFTTKVTSGGAAVAGALVALSQGTTAYTAVTDAGGNATLNHGFTSGTVTLVVTGLNLATQYQTVTVGGGGNNPPVANFTFAATQLAVSFTDTSTDSDGTITGRSWNFGDGGTSTAANPSHTYAAAGTYTVTLTVTDNGGATNGVSKSVTVSAAANNPPVANFSFTATQLVVAFTDTSTDSDGTIAARSWNFGDGGTATTANPSHTYAAAGTYTVTLTVTDDDGATNSVSKSVTVSSGGNDLSNGQTVSNLSAAQGAWLYYRINVPAGATNLVMSISGGTGDADLYTRYNAQPTTSAYDCRPYKSGNVESCSVASPSAGYYYIGIRGYSAFSGVSLTASYTAPGGNVAPTASFTKTATGLTVAFTDTSTDSDGTIAARSWNFGDGGTSTTANPSHTYAAAGTYTVTLTVTDDDGATGSTQQSVTVSSSGADGFTVTSLSGSKGTWKYYSITVPAGMARLEISISGGTGDADLYVRKGAQPTTTLYDYRPYLSGNNESVTVSSPAAATWYIGIRGYAAYSGVTLKAYYYPTN